jgi:hypothetical protein
MIEVVAIPQTRDRRYTDSPRFFRSLSSKANRGLHHIPSGAKVFLLASIERSFWRYFPVKAEQKGIDLSELLTDVLKRDIEIDEALK